MKRKLHARQTQYNKVLDAIDWFVGKAREKEMESIHIGIGQITAKSDVPRSTLYHIAIYDKLRMDYSSVSYESGSGEIEVQCEEWVEERKKEQKKKSESKKQGEGRKDE